MPQKASRHFKLVETDKNIILTVNAAIFDVDKVSVLVWVTQLMVRWIVEHAWSEAAAAFSVASHDVWMIGWSRAV